MRLVKNIFLVVGGVVTTGITALLALYVYDAFRPKIIGRLKMLGIIPITKTDFAEQEFFDDFDEDWAEEFDEDLDEGATSNPSRRYFEAPR